MIQEDKTKIFSHLNGITLKVYIYMLRTAKEVGPSDVKHALNLKTASHASYHLNKLIDLGIAQKTLKNTYKLNPEFQVKSLKANVLMDYYLIMGKLWPRTAFLAAFIFFSFLANILLIIAQLLDVLKVFIVFTFVVSLGLVGYEAWVYKEAVDGK